MRLVIMVGVVGVFILDCQMGQNRCRVTVRLECPGCLTCRFTLTILAIVCFDTSPLLIKISRKKYVCYHDLKEGGGNVMIKVQNQVQVLPTASMGGGMTKRKAVSL
ncbi:hypothetical protein B0T13DRAFT_470194 [Neurospora crassa]|nr:hypothetical protein B0T13DRAFT_484347 [Neurospora crassa]KAK3498647.1 hypothetical protein B0T13DRAFT_470194 [Neurospora crassa]